MGKKVCSYFYILLIHIGTKSLEAALIGIRNNSKQALEAALIGFLFPEAPLMGKFCN